MIRKLLAASYYKLIAMFGGLGTLPVVYILMALCFAAFASALKAPAPKSVVLAVYDECGSERSTELVKALGEVEGVEITAVGSKEQGEDELLKGRAEVLMTVCKDYDELLLSNTAEKLISLESAPGAVSAELIRETVAGILLSRKSLASVQAELEEDGLDISRMDEYMGEFELPELYGIETHGSQSSGERALFGKAFAKYEGISALVLLLLLLTLSRRMTDGASRVSAYKLYSVSNGRSVAFASDLGALWGAGLIGVCIALPFAPDLTHWLVFGLIAYSLCIAGLCLLISRFGSAGRIDIAAPVIALATSVVGGCFMDVASLSPALSALARCTPQGQLMAAAGGAWLFAVLLFAEGALFALLAGVVERHSIKK